MDENKSEIAASTAVVSEVAASLPAKQPTPKKRFSKPDMFTEFLILRGWSHWFFRLGFASIFLVNAVYAAVQPDDFAKLLTDNFIAGKIGFTDLLVKFAMVNDLLIGIFIISGWRKQLVYGWAGAWLLMVAGLKLTNYIF